MTPTRRLLAISTLAAIPLLLAGCDKPNPEVTVWSGTSSVHVPALCWAHEENVALTPKECATEVLTAAAQGQGAAQLDVAPGATIGISVDPVVADGGWSIQIGGQPLAANLTDTYFRFTFPETGVTAGGEGFVMQVVSQAKPTGNRGHWFFRLLPQ
jgi:hypothetical protein